MDVSTPAGGSVGASLIPFPEHDDANRALMVNMQRRASDSARHARLARASPADSGVIAVAKRGGTRSVRGCIPYRYQS